MFRFSHLAVVIAIVSILIVVLRNPHSPPCATTTFGELIGRRDGDVDKFTAVPYAQPPTGQLRLRRPQPLNQSFGRLILPESEMACPQAVLPAIVLPPLPPDTAKVVDMITAPYPGPQGEDCLSLTVTRPAGTRAADSLPVVVWFHGGGFQVGGSVLYDGGVMVRQSMAIDKPILHVSVQYRLGAWGFLPGRLMQASNNTNLGLRDQRLALEWTAENIAAFGGDPDRVTLWGHSAGAMSAYTHLIINNGDHHHRGKPLFRGVILNSGSLLPTLPVDSDKAEHIFSTVASAAGCHIHGDPVDCLRSISYESFLNASNSLDVFRRTQFTSFPYIFRPDVTDSFLPQSAAIASAQGSFAHVPTIIGTMQDEGTLFVLLNRHLVSNELAVNYLQEHYLGTTASGIHNMMQAYPNDPAIGSPYGTGTDDAFYPSYKQLAAIIGDLTFVSRAWQAAEALVASAPVWKYLGTYLQGFELIGSYHLSDIMQMYYLMPNATLGAMLNSYYINFVHDVEPNGIALPHWPQWNGTNKKYQSMVFGAKEFTVMNEDLSERWPVDQRQFAV